MKTKMFKTIRRFSFVVLGLLAVSPLAAFAATTIGTNLSTAGNLVVNGSVQFTNGAGVGYILQSDGTGNAAWVDVLDLPAGTTTDSILRWSGAAWVEDTNVLATAAGNLTANGDLDVLGNTTLGDATGDTLTFNASTLSVPNSLNIDSNTLFIDATNNRVGIGTTGPAQKLDVAGKIALDGTTVVYRPTTMTDTLVLGDGGTNLLHTAGSDGYYNTFVGIGVGAANTTGYKNAAIGADAFKFNTTGYYNTATGVNALISNTTGYANTANGADALLSNTTGYNNTGFGAATLFFNTTGIGNSASGNNSLSTNTSGNYNSALGNAALNQNTTGNDNTATGYKSLRNNTTGSFNTSVGDSALFTNTTGSYNTANGTNAGRFIADGITANTTSSNSVYEGYDTRALVNGGTNEIVIGASAIGNGSNTVTLGNTSITKTILNGNVGVGTTSPDFRLDVAGNLRLESANRLYFGGTGAGDTLGNLYHDATDFVFSDDIKATGYKSSDGSAGLTTTITVRASGGLADCTLTVKNGLITATTCP